MMSGPESGTETSSESLLRPGEPNSEADSHLGSRILTERFQRLRQALERGEEYSDEEYLKSPYGDAIYDQQGYSAEGYIKDAYDNAGYKQEGYTHHAYHKVSYHKAAYAQDAYRKAGHYSKTCP